MFVLVLWDPVAVVLVVMLVLEVRIPGSMSVVPLALTLRVPRTVRVARAYERRQRWGVATWSTACRSKFKQEQV